MNHMLRRASLYGIGLGLILVSAAVGIVFITISLHAWLTPLIGAAWAGLLLGVLLSVPAIAYAIWAYLRHRQYEREEMERAALAAQAGQQSLSPVIAAVVGLLGALFRAKPVTTTALAATAGVLASRNPRLIAAAARRILPRLLP